MSLYFKRIFILLLVIKLVSLREIDPTKNVTLPDWPSINVTSENHYIIQERGRDNEQVLINNVAYRGNALQDYQIGLRQMNLFMRENYHEMLERVGHNVFPLIIATDVDHDKRLSGTGSEYILYLRNGTIRHMKPTPVQYEQNKNLGHLPLSIFTIISPYFNNPTSTMWHEKLQKLQTIIQNNLEGLKAIPVVYGPPRLVWANHVFCDDNLTVDDHRAMLTMVLDFINSCFNSKRVDVVEYKKFARAYVPYIRKAMTCAAQIQTKAAVRELSKWKAALGSEAWREVYVIIPVVWPVARVNPRQLIFEQLLDADRVATHILKAEGARNIEEARFTAGRIIADRTMAHLVFGYDTPDHLDSNLALSSRQDLLATKAKESLTEVRPLSSDTTADEDVEPNQIQDQIGS